MHVINLMIEAAFESFNASDLYGWSAFFSHRMKMRAAATNAGVSYRLATTAGTRFGSKLPFLAELSDPKKFELWRDFALKHPPSSVGAQRSDASGGRLSRGGARGRGRGRGRGAAASGDDGPSAAAPSESNSLAIAARDQEASRYTLLTENMADVFTNAAIAVLDALLSDLAPLLGAVQCTVRTLSFDFWQSWDAAETERVSWFNDPDIRLAALMDEKGIVLDSEARAKLVTAIEYTIEKMDDKVDSHLMETFTEVRCRARAGEALNYTKTAIFNLLSCIFCAECLWRRVF
jgi:hypothetical protein